MAPLSAVRCASEVTVVLDSFPVDELRDISLIPVQKLPRERIQLLPSSGKSCDVEESQVIHSLHTN